MVLTGGGAGPVDGGVEPETEGEDTAAEDTFGTSDAAGPARAESRGQAISGRDAFDALECPFGLNAHDLFAFFDSGLPTAAGWL